MKQRLTASVFFSAFALLGCEQGDQSYRDAPSRADVLDGRYLEDEHANQVNTALRTCQEDDRYSLFIEGPITVVNKEQGFIRPLSVNYTSSSNLRAIDTIKDRYFKLEDNHLKHDGKLAFMCFGEDAPDLTFFLE